MARDADTSSPTRTEVFPSLTAELIFAANLIASSDDSLRGDPEWISAQREQITAGAREAVPAFVGYWWPTMGLVDFLCWYPLFQEPEAFLDRVEACPIDRFLAVLFNDDLSMRRIGDLLSDPTQARILGDDLSRFSTTGPDQLERLFRDPEGHRRQLLTLVRGSDTPLFRQSFTQTLLDARSAVQTLERRLTNEAPLALAASLREKPLKGPRSYQRVTFVPSRLIGHRHIQSWGNDHAVFFLQLGTLALNGPTETGAELAEFLKVLSDKTRMDILRLLCKGPSYGKEIATTLGLTTATVSRHLDQLKVAGLVREDKADSNNVKRLRYIPESLDIQFERLKTYLLPS